ncbi:hypothetical protein HK097_011246 [Rhizophlyctis rosea]|uniref:cellulase n=1 Tax=Rhizophlyctis rosea TaxID=64517 RepID=A0AAD5S818_9FUNG|nr:hypothetical protein HK097_011246 [Rhizophlyctis rosea]
MLFNKLPALFGLLGVAEAAVKYTGTNQASLEFGVGVSGPNEPANFPGAYDKQYTQPNVNAIPYWRNLGANTFRLCFSWERAQPTVSGSLDETYVKYLDNYVNAATSAANGAQYVVLDVHNYARYNGKIVGSDIPQSSLTDFWTKLANRYKGNDRVIIDIMNEPHDLPIDQWYSAAQATVNAIRATGFKNLILVPGISWTGAHSWISSGNGAAALSITDPLNNFAFDMHQYFDTDYSGTNIPCTHRSEVFDAATSWLRANNRRAFLGEFAISTDSSCKGIIEDALQYLDDNSDVWIGWTWWAAGPWWGDYMYSVEPTSVTSGDKPQTSSLKKFFAGNSVNPGPKAGSGSTTTTTRTTTTTTTRSSTTTTRSSTTATCAGGAVTVTVPGGQTTVTVQGPATTVTVTAGQQQQTTTRTTTTTTTTRGNTSGSAALYGQCGGQGWTGPTTCASGTCKVSNQYYSQCLP